MKYSIILLLVTISISIVMCTNGRNKKHHKDTTKLIEQLYVETYTDFGSGAFGTDIVSDYLTDSISFRKYVGTFDEGPEYYYYNILGDTIYIEKYKSSEDKAPKKLLDKRYLLISDLKRTGTFE